MIFPKDRSDILITLYFIETVTVPGDSVLVLLSVTPVPFLDSGVAIVSSNMVLVKRKFKMCYD